MRGSRGFFDVRACNKLVPTSALPAPVVVGCVIGTVTVVGLGDASDDDLLGVFRVGHW